MLNYIWCFIIIISIICALLTGSMEELTNCALDSCGEAVSLCITMLGIIAMWSGIMEIARKAGIIRSITDKILPLMCWLFPDVPKESKAMEYLTTNMIANFLGLGWAATPPALLAMKELAAYNNNSETASDSMCTFLVINISSVQLIPINIIAYRTAFGSPNPGIIIGPAILATLCSTLAAIIFCKICTRLRKGGRP